MALPALLAGIGNEMGQAYLEFQNRRIVPIFFTAVSANASTGKTQAMGYVQTAHADVEAFLQIPDELSHQVNAPTVESFIQQLKNIQNVVGESIIFFFIIMSV
jgi:hypothetical protein